MDPKSVEIIHDFQPMFRILASGEVDRYEKHDFLPPSADPQSGVVSKDVVYSPEKKLSARLYLPQTPTPAAKLPLLIYIHGGGFSIQSAFSSFYHPYVNSLAAASNSIVVSIEYRLAPEHPLPACYDDSYEALQWLSSHSQSDPWLSQFADFNRVYAAGDSAGANIAHDMVFRSTGDSSSLGFKFSGLILIHPYFGRGKRDKLWDYICPEKSEENQFRYNPAADPGRLSKLGCDRVLICLAEKDFIRGGGWNYYQGLKKSGWKPEGGAVELVETAGEGHVFHLIDRDCGNAISLMNRVSEFVNGVVHPTSHF